MKVLVIDNKEIHRQAAQAQLGDEHELTIVSTQKEAEEKIYKDTFDVVLTDLFMPPTSGLSSNASNFKSQEMPLGIILTLLAAQKGATYVVVVSDVGHHDHPIVASFENFSEALNVNGAKVFLHSRNAVRDFHPNDLTNPIKLSTRASIENSVRAKDWLSVLKRLV